MSIGLSCFSALQCGCSEFRSTDRSIRAVLRAAFVFPSLLPYFEHCDLEDQERKSKVTRDEASANLNEQMKAAMQDDLVLPITTTFKSENMVVSPFNHGPLIDSLEKRFDHAGPSFTSPKRKRVGSDPILPDRLPTTCRSLSAFYFVSTNRNFELSFSGKQN